MVTSRGVVCVLHETKRSTLQASVRLSPLGERVRSVFGPHGVSVSYGVVSGLLLPCRGVVGRRVSGNGRHGTFRAFLRVLRSLSCRFIGSRRFYCFSSVCYPSCSYSSVLGSVVTRVGSNGITVRSITCLSTNVSGVTRVRSCRSCNDPFYMVS